jgi:putative chitinase
MLTSCFDLSAVTAPPMLAKFYAPFAYGDGLAELMRRMAADAANWATVDQVAYGLATAKRETGGRFRPVCEQGPAGYFAQYEPGTASGQAVGNTQPGDGYLFRGRGYVQITGRDNYARIGRLLGMGDGLVNDPEKALDPEVAYRVFAEGMRGGWFTGYKLRYFVVPGQEPDFVHARRVVNGLDCAEEIAATAVQYVGMLGRGVVGVA